MTANARTTTSRPERDRPTQAPPPTAADLARRYRAAAHYRRTLTGTSDATTNATIHHTVAIIQTTRALLAAGRRDLVLALSAESDIRDQIAQAAPEHELSRLRSRRRAASRQVNRLARGPQTARDRPAANGPAAARISPRGPVAHAPATVTGERPPAP